MDPKRRSSIVNLSLIGLPLATIAAANLIPEETVMRRNLYPDRAACERDYTPQQCEQSSGSGSSGGGSGSGWHGGGYHGPYYTTNRSSAAVGDPGSGRTGVNAVSYETSARGGFGSFGRAVRAVG
jgi:hypothetical protein